MKLSSIHESSSSFHSGKVGSGAGVYWKDKAPIVEAGERADYLSQCFRVVDVGRSMQRQQSVFVPTQSQKKILLACEHSLFHITQTVDHDVTDKMYFIANHSFTKQIVT